MDFCGVQIEFVIDWVCVSQGFEVSRMITIFIFKFMLILTKRDDAGSEQWGIVGDAVGAVLGGSL